MIEDYLHSWFPLYYTAYDCVGNVFSYYFLIMIQVIPQQYSILVIIYCLTNHQHLSYTTNYFI